MSGARSSRSEREQRDQRATDAQRQVAGALRHGEPASGTSQVSMHEVQAPDREQQPDGDLHEAREREQHAAQAPAAPHATPMKKPKCRCACTPAAAPSIIAVFMHSSATGSVQLGESFST